jgi:hypothetical protein
MKEENFIVRFFRTASPEMLEAFDELAELDRMYGARPTPPDHVYRSGKTARQAMQETEQELRALGQHVVPHRWPE